MHLRTATGRSAFAVRLVAAAVAGVMQVVLGSDLVGRRAVLVALFLVEALACLALPRAGSLPVFGLLAFLVVAWFGGGLGTTPALVADYFGAEKVTPIFGMILTASGFGSLVGSTILARGREMSGSYEAPWLVLGVLMLVGAAIPLSLRPPDLLAGRSRDAHPAVPAARRPPALVEAR